MEFEAIVSQIKNAKSIIILPHIHIDGDCLGSALALYMMLVKKGKTVTIYVEEDIPYNYGFLPGVDVIKRYSQNELPDRADVAIAVDTGDMGRLGKRAEIFKKAEVTVNIDHHGTNTNYAAYNLVKSDYAATGEIIYEFADALGLNVGSDMAVCLYVAIATDTGGFKYSNTKPMTHLIASELMQKGIDISDISRRVFDSISLAKAKLMGAAINALELYENGRIAYIYISNAVLNGTGALEEDCEGIVNIGRNIRGVEVSVMLRESNGGIKGNLRANTYMDVSVIASLFSGGGHVRAAGFSVKGSVNDIRDRLFKEIKKRL
jgi:bifunctional oligoribonuclease and PAP phosphatase NrnA